MAKTGDIVSGAVLAGLGVFIIVEARGWELVRGGVRRVPVYTMNNHG